MSRRSTRTGSSSGRAHPRRLLCLSLAAVPLLATADASAQVQASWLNTSGGQWTEPSNWSTNPFYPNNGNPPGTAYEATISGPIGFSPAVNFEGPDVTVNSLDLRGSGAHLFHRQGR